MTKIHNGSIINVALAKKVTCDAILSYWFWPERASIVEGLNLKELFIDMYCPLWMFLVGSFGLDLFQVKIAKRLRLS